MGFQIQAGVRCHRGLVLSAYRRGLLPDGASGVTLPASAAAWLTGYIPDLPTPFEEAGRVDLKAFGRLCERQIAAGVSALVV